MVNIFNVTIEYTTIYGKDLFFIPTGYLLTTWNIASQAPMCDRNAFPSPWPSCAPLTKPAISTT